VQGSAVFNLLRNFGSSLFISLSVLVLVRSTAENYAGLSAAVSSMDSALAYSGLAENLAVDDARRLAALSEEMHRQAAIGGYLNTFMMFALAAAAALPLVWMFRAPKRRF
jgi:DHA2 family multidrug resistance protein